jgi:hypothetical protein
MSTTDQRLDLLEHDVALIKPQILAASGHRDWLSAVTGSMQDFPEFADVLRFGREFREGESATKSAAQPEE